MLEQDPKKTRGSGEGGRRKKGTGTEAQVTPKRAAVKGAASTSAETPKKRAAKKTKGAGAETPRVEPVTAEERHRMIAEAAYYIAEQRGFQGGDPEQDWREAEAQIGGMLRS